MKPRSNCMPSTTSSTVSVVFDSSTVITPSLPTFSMASATSSPMAVSLWAEIVATCAFSFRVFHRARHRLERLDRSLGGPVKPPLEVDGACARHDIA